MRRQYSPTRRQYNSTGSNSTEPTYSTNSSLSFTPATGVPGGDIVSRLPIKTLQDEHPDVFNMYILAVNSFMKKNSSDWMSWFRVSGESCPKTNDLSPSRYYLSPLFIGFYSRDPWVPISTVPIP
jgi:hypothetical protein